MNLFLRRQGLGLGSIRNLKSKMTSQSTIFRVDLRSFVPQHDYAINWGNSRLNYTFNNVINSPEAISEISNKGKFRVKLYEAGLSMFTTNTLGNVNIAVGSEHKKLLVRPANHMGGSNIHVVETMGQIEPAIRACGYGWYASEYIPKVKEFRVFVASGRVVYVVEKVVPDTTAIAWNVHQGGSFVNVPFGGWNLKVVKSAVDAFNLTKLDFGAVDVIVDANGNAYVLEINSAPAMTSEYWSTCVAKAFDYIITHGKDRMALIQENGGWRKFIHPAISSEAIIPQQTPRSHIERREVMRTRTVNKTANWHIAVQNVTSDEKDRILRTIAQQILDTDLPRGEVTFETQETYLDYEEVEVFDN